MKSTVYELTAPLTLGRCEVELNEHALAASAILARTQFTAVSTGTELAAWLGLPPLRPSTVYPRLVGYCNLARVLAVGSAVTDVSAGDYVLTHQSHRSAYLCGRSEVLLRVKKGATDQELKKLTTTYLYHLGYAALLSAGYRPGHEVAIVGMGTIGVALASLVRAFGGAPLVFTNQAAAEPSARHERRFCKDVQPREALGCTGDLGGVDIAVTTSNAWADYRLCLELARKGGEVTCVGFPGRGEEPPDFNPLDSRYIYDKQLTIRHCGYATELDASPIDARFTLKRNMAYLARLVRRGALDPSEILSLERRWDRLADVYRQLASRPAGIRSALLDWRS
jgi:threonine dehydrogenase-like Zn-dependent dehydrogenase